ncbi:hypothetical protein GCM10011490_23450 [Pseudoclavibacter endophyticus]|uniref:Uncharacterized protein n=1 Tax=Pseudoclavibacter endophyticus TaxID=1778590 RepID=A0A6H9WQL4_9MICO|nr:hypothetical protein [Pseudoclavibacter endophyticus]KAB1648361.1 hypothetical protein F8O04_11760 [Pseudoclavibacter endophyticus]GGA72009.1 hypothetical protein GCM10011490_23450 [Pseudoclavibacter endophyticus]
MTELPDWDELPEGLRHPKNLARLAIEQLSLPADSPCRVLIVQDAGWRDGRVYVEVERIGGRTSRIDIEKGDGPSTLAARITAVLS